MSTEPEPVRWLDPGSEVSPELRAALLDARADLPSPEVLARIRAGALAKAAAAAKLGLVLKLLIGSVVLGTIAFQFWPEAERVGTQEKPSPTVAAPARELPTAPEPAPPPAPSIEVAPSPPKPRAASPSAPVPDELDLLESAQRVLSENPREALRLTRLSAKHHPGGSFVPEREALAIQALLSLGKEHEAKARYERLRSDHPESAVLRRLEEILRSED